MTDTVYSDPNFTRTPQWLKMSDIERNHYRQTQRSICSYNKFMGILKPHMNNRPIEKPYTMKTNLYYDYSDRRAKTHDQLTDKSCHKILSEDGNRFVNVFPTQPISVTVCNYETRIDGGVTTTIAFKLANNEITTIHSEWHVSIEMIGGYAGVDINSIGNDQWVEFTKILESIIPMFADLQE